MSTFPNQSGCVSAGFVGADFSEVGFPAANAGASGTGSVGKGTAGNGSPGADSEAKSIPGGFAAARLTVVSDSRVHEAQAEARGLGYSAGYAAGVRAANAETEQLRARLAATAERQQEQAAAQLERSLDAFAAAVHAANSRVLPLLDDSRSLLYSLALDLASAALGVAVAEPQGTPRSAVEDELEAEFAGDERGSHFASHPATHSALNPHSATNRAVLSESLSDDVTRGAFAALTRALSVSHDVCVTTIRMHPADAAQVMDHWDRLQDLLGESARHVRILPDASLSVGDAVSEFEDGFLDARLKTAMSRARAALDAELEAMELVRRSQSHSIDAASAGILPSSV